VSGDSRIPRPGLRFGGRLVVVVPVVVELSGGGGVDALPHLSTGHRLGVVVSRRRGDRGGAGSVEVLLLVAFRVGVGLCHQSPTIFLKPLVYKGF
jgi:hypothetical protein